MSKAGAYTWSGSGCPCTTGEVGVEIVLSPSRQTEAIGASQVSSGRRWRAALRCGWRFGMSKRRFRLQTLHNRTQSATAYGFSPLYVDAHMYLANFSNLRRVLLLHRYLHPASPRRSRDGLGRETGGCSGRGLPRSREDPERLRRALERSRCRQWRMPCAPADDAPYGPCGKQLYGIQLRKSFDVDRRCLRIFHRRRWTSFSTIFGLLQQRIT